MKRDGGVWNKWSELVEGGSLLTFWSFFFVLVYFNIDNDILINNRVKLYDQI